MLSYGIQDEPRQSIQENTQEKRRQESAQGKGRKRAPAGNTTNLPTQRGTYYTSLSKPDTYRAR